MSATSVDARDARTLQPFDNAQTFARAPMFGSAACLLVLTLLTGCSTNERPLYPVQGQVTFEGKPVHQGDILFIPTDPRWGPEAGRIVDGKYTLQAAEGEHRVEVTALDIGPHTKYLDGSPLAKNMIPERFNVRSELKAQVTSGDNVHDFNLPPATVSPARPTR